MHQKIPSHLISCGRLEREREREGRNGGERRRGGEIVQKHQVGGESGDIPAAAAARLHRVKAFSFPFLREYTRKVQFAKDVKRLVIISKTI